MVRKKSMDMKFDLYKIVRHSKSYSLFFVQGMQSVAYK